MTRIPLDAGASREELEGEIERGLDENALDIAYAAACNEMIGPNPHRDEIAAAIRAYQSALEETGHG